MLPPLEIHEPTGPAGPTGKREMDAKLWGFLNARKSVRGGARYTHASLGSPAGSYTVSDEDTPELMRLYACSVSGGHRMHLTEAHKPIGPVVIDFDLRQQTATRAYTPELVEALVDAIAETVRHYVTVQNEMTVFVMEKGEAARPDAKKVGTFKDGLHLCIPDVITIPKVQKLIRRRFIETQGELLSQLPTVTNSIQDIYDESVIESSGWFLYGSRKPGEEHAWNVTKCWTVGNDGTKRAVQWGDDASLTETLSIRRLAATESEYSAAYADDTTFVNAPPPQRQSPPPSVNSQTTSGSSVAGQSYEQALALVDLLSDQRADAEPTWMRVGWCLHHVEQSERMLNLWDAFSRKSPKYADEECRRRWAAMTTLPDGRGLDMGSLHMWAREDDPEGYARATARMRFTANSKVTWDTLQHSTTLHPYKVVKAIFERSHFKVMSPLCYVCDDSSCSPSEGGMVIRNESKMREAFRNLFCSITITGETGGVTERKAVFAKVWLDDPNIRTYLQMDFMPPPMLCPPRTYNMWGGFATDVALPSSEHGGDLGIAPLVSEAPLVNPFMAHLSLITNHDARGTAYLLKWLAHLVQRPGELNNIAIILRSEQGCGKSLLLEFVKLMIGEAYYFETANPEQEVFSRFAVGRKNRLLINIDEAGVLKFANQLKNMLTSTSFNYEQKGIDAITLRNFNRVVVTTNLDLPCKIESDDRRFVMFQCSAEKRGDKAYFDGFVKYMRDPASRAAVMRHLRGVELGDVNWIRDRPASEIYTDARYDCIDLVLRFMEALHLGGAYKSEILKVWGSELFREFLSWLVATNHPTTSWNATNFGRHVGDYVKKSGGGVVKTTDSAKRAVYCFNRAPLERYLKASGLLIGRGFEWVI